MIMKALLLVLLAVPGGVQDATPPELVRTIPLPKVEGRIDHLALDARAGRLSVAALGNNTVEVIDLAQGKVVQRIDGLPEPQGLLSLNGQIVVASGGDGSCRFYDGGTFKLMKTVDCKDDADNVRYDAGEKRVYVGAGGGALAVIDPEKGAKVGEIPLSAHPESFQLESKGKRIFVNVPKAGHVAVVDREKRAVTATWKISAGSNFPMALDEEGRRVFIGCRQPARLLVLDTDSGKELASVDCVGDADDVFYEAATKRVFVTGGEGHLDVFGAAAAPKRVSRVATAAGARTCLLDAEAGLLYVALPHRGAQAAEIRVYKVRP
jgi:DNA-binding beta-propeller fold protein YncE